jgi:hypothetical protein
MHMLVRHPRPIFNKHSTTRISYSTTMATSDDDDDAPMEAPPGKESNEEDSDVELEGKKKAVEHIIERSRRNVTNIVSLSKKELTSTRRKKRRKR